MLAAAQPRQPLIAAIRHIRDKEIDNPIHRGSLD
jgi:hypothetical protein